MSTTNGFNQFLVPAEDGFLYQLIYNTVSAGNTGCTININGTEVQMGANSSIDILVKTLSGGVGCVLGGDRPYIYGDSPQYKYVPQTFVSVWDTTRTSAGSSTATQVKLPLVSTGTYNFIVDWGDGSTDRITSWNQAQTTHTYATTGTYQVIITGTIQGFGFANTGDRLKILSIFKWGTAFRLGNNGAYFQGCENLQLNQVEDVLDLTNTTTFNSIFAGCYSLTTIGRVNEWNTSNITTLQSAFQNAINFDDNIGGWNVANVTTFNSFLLCNNAARGKFNNGGSSDIGNWNTSNVTDMGNMFAYQRFFNQDIGTKVVTVNGNTYTAWDVKNVTSFIFFLGTTTFSGVFNNGGSDSIKNWNTSKATTLRSMLQNQILFNQDIGTKVVTVGDVTYTAWDTKEVTSIAFLFNCAQGDAVFNNANSDSIKNWNTSKMTDMRQSFAATPFFNQDISTKTVTVNGVTYTAWDTSLVTNMQYMFFAYPSPRQTGVFNQNISNWNTSNNTTMLEMFRNQTLFNQPLDSWNVAKVTTLGATFYNATAFNQPLNSWNTAKVTNMSDTFFNATAFNQSISNWNVSGVTTFGTSGFMSGKTDVDYSAENYDNLLINWASRTVQPNQVLNMGTIKRTEGSTAAKTILTSAPNNWTIIDGGLALPFTSIWRTTASNETVTLPYLASGANYTGIIDWGDGFTSGNTYANRTHTYATAGDYTISINGMISGFCFNNTGDRLKLREITRWSSTFRPNNSSGTFFGCANLVLTGVTDTLNLAGMTSLAYFFADCTSLTTVNRINEWNTTNITSLLNTFVNAINFNADIGDWNTENVTNMQSTFRGNLGKFNKYIGNWNTSKVTDMTAMFEGNTNFNQDISTKVVTVNGVTYVAWDTLNVTNMSFMLSARSGNVGVFNQNIGNWNTSKVTDMSVMFSGQFDFNQDISTKVVTVGASTYTAWDTLNVTAMNFMLGNGNVSPQRQGSFNQNIGNWNTSKVTNMNAMFQVQPLFNQDISTKVVTVGSNTYIAWDTLNVTNMTGMLIGSFPISIGTFNQNIGNWNTSKVTTMSSMFNRQPLFNQDISTKVVSVSGVSYTAWSTSNVTAMNSILFIGSGATGTFNQNISNWNTSKLINASFMFSRQPNFNQNIGIWDVSKVTNMATMLLNTTNFNQNLANWNVSLVTLFNSATVPTDTFADGIGLSTANYDALLIGWASRPVLANKAINFGTIKYTSAAVAARAVLTSAPNNWTIVDGGLT